MNKKVILALGMMCSATIALNVGYAAPMTDYSQGKVSIDLTIANSNDVKVNTSTDGFGSFDTSYDGKNSVLDLGLTIGLGKFGIQYRDFAPKTKTTYIDEYLSNANYEAKFKEFNVLYKLNNYSAAFIGYHQAKGSVQLDYGDPVISNPTFSSDTKNTMQIGLIGKTPLAKDLDLFGIVAFGGDLSNYEIGLAQRISKDMDFNIGYREKHADNLNFYDSVSDSTFRHDVKVSGWNYGLTFRFDTK
ncbi:MAG TPA: hypothetical protein PKA28_12665 [Methylomusa anaerophila]|uniref:Outer membrane protein beta-barrel domain-containing protein n=1 Tax=Methylomusa anaerophila TaxID=1930071 RepID=A0A348AH21_9FIRM|nr:hypothetical protein [Methylomusa anaerophila]BBB90369.1 hypothetical protein MAMMFC1_01017 [Methylomusa anaerophila]HML89284.1 hypothetical protein [Methylomusa anaerophila]